MSTKIFEFAMKSIVIDKIKINHDIKHGIESMNKDWVSFNTNDKRDVKEDREEERINRDTRSNYTKIKIKAISFEIFDEME